MSERALVRHARSLALERAAAWLLSGSAAGLCYGALVHAPLTGLAGGVLLALAAVIAAQRFRPISPGDVARHLDRALPEFEDSTTLLLAPDSSLTGLGRLQRERLEARWNEARVRAALPHTTLRRSVAFTALLAGAGALLLLRPAVTAGPEPRHPPGQRAGPLALRGVTLEIRPPAYTGAADRTLPAGDVTVEEGARVTWRVELAGTPSAVWLGGSGGDSLPLRREGRRWIADLTASRSALYRVRARDGTDRSLVSEDLRLGVRPDRAPVLTMVHPGERTELLPEALRPVAVELLATDDYGVDSATLSVTIASGRGEAVRFRRLSLPLARAGPRTRLRLTATLDPAGLQLGPGDELYAYAEAGDGRVPTPNHSRSATIFVSVHDTAATGTADLARMALGVEPEYFRSQRQIIIDTEKLLAGRARIPVEEFKDRSNGIGMDQGALRLRYGQFLGEEFEEETSDVGETHEHDNAENATLLAATVKQKLRAAVGAMWQSELHLRVNEPDLALPFEYRALELIKQVQQDARVYVQRVGFEPPPIEVEKIRLTGKLDDLAGQHRTRDLPRHDSLPAVRAALVAVSAGLTSPGEESRRLEAAGQELAALAVENPALLGLLRDLRRLADARAAGTSCDGCADRVLRGLWRVLPPAEPASRRPLRGSATLSRLFQQRIAGDRP